MALDGCGNDPAAPVSVYFTLGDVVAALGVTLILPQFLKPIYLLRLKIRRISMASIYRLVFAGVLPIAVAALLPQFPASRTPVVGYPLFWESLGALLFVVAYALLAFGSLKPIRLRAGSVDRFVRASAELLAEANERDFVDFATDFARNLPDLIKRAAFIEHRPAFSAFEAFRYRKQITDGRFAASFLGIASDPKFCASLVTSCPWQAADIMNSITREQLSSQFAERFVQELARQTILLDQSMMSREVGYGGFSVAPVLSESLFGNHFISRTYDPFVGLRFGNLGTPTTGMMARLSAAAELSVKASFHEKSYWPGPNIHHLEDIYEHVFRELDRMKRGDNLEVALLVEASSGVHSLIDITRAHLAELPSNRLLQLYKKGSDPYDGNNVIEAIAGLIYKTLESISNSFDGINDPFWSHAIGVFMHLFPFDPDEPVGMDPLQQRVALKLLNKLHENMEGWYPAISRILLACMGPYQKFPNIKNRSAYVVLDDAIYAELKHLKMLATGNPDKFKDFLPGTTQYDLEENTLTHTYAGGAQSVTKLDEIGPKSKPLRGSEPGPIAQPAPDGVTLVGTLPMAG
ncbi:hypothetical protein [Paramagnetospirillum kuznetsovii]|uniref:hypothetical protein n=1 Tax=Paramagnetospirillum kuznetsovii TaxID=2053833 RepID=UPI0011BFDB0C|nr:hypothetical protein [Paramagnetospirillum kuznetsovii]